MSEEDIVEEETVVEAANPTDAIADARKEAEAIIAKAKADALALTEKAETDADEVAKQAEEEAKDIKAKAKAKAKADADKTKSHKLKITPETPKSPKDIVATGGVYKAVRKCYFGIRMYDKGSPLQTTKGDIIPHHFKKVVRMVEVTEDE